MRGHRRIIPRDSAADAAKSMVKKSKTGSISVGLNSGEKSFGQRNASLGKSASEKPFDLRKFTVERIWSRVLGDGVLTALMK
ncbi:hypothetical protein F0562_020582 [Nyssa sinensis]|uniref:Uncharacterized protein n=1 Tax=Nyssa sinensis TaxID=561372 RepID=A0A5J5BW76_9ASTE|nr:hypothetical protein F0562_020582 [Nyssa sinensis]